MAIIESLRTLKAQFAAGHQRYPRLHHAILWGLGVHDWPETREALKRLIVGENPFQEYDIQLAQPHGFFFGQDLEAVPALDAVAAQALQLLQGESLPFAAVEEIEDWGTGHGYLRLAYALWKKQQSALAPPFGKITVETESTATPPAPEFGSSLRFPDGSGADHPGRFQPLRQRQSTRTNEAWAFMVESVRSGNFEHCLINRQSVFLTAELGIDAILAELSKPPAPPKRRCAVEIGDGQTVQVSGVEKGLGSAQFRLVNELVKAFPNRLTHSVLEKRSNVDGPQKTLKTLADKDADWSAVILFPSGSGEGYGLADYPELPPKLP